MTILDSALDYIAKGWSVIPLALGTKFPAIKIADYLNGTERFGEMDARKHWGRELAGPPSFGIGIVTGAPSRLAVVDIDPRNGGDLNLGADFGIVAAVETGGGGAHLYCKMPEGADWRCGKTSKPGVDLKANGGYVVAPPSPHPSGGVYRWLMNTSQAPLGTVPAWALEGPTSSDSPGAVLSGPWIAELLDHPELVPAGAQQESLTRLCWWAARHLPEDIAESILCRWASSLVLYRPHDPWTIEHVSVRLRSAYHKQAMNPTPPPIPGVVDGALPYVFKRIVDLEFPTQAWVVEDFVASGACTEIVGKVKKGKSTLVYQLVNAVRQGEPFLGRKTLLSGAVILTEQMGTSLKETLKRAGLLEATNVYVMQKADIGTVGGFAEAADLATKLCQREGLKLLVVDTLSRLAGLGGDSENQAGAVGILDAFVAARELGIACVFVRHARKGQNGVSDDIADAARGSSAITGDMDIVIRLAPSGDLRCLSWESRITDDPDDVYLQYHDGVYVVVDEPDSPRHVAVDARRAAMAAALLENPGATTAWLRERLGWGSDHTVTKYRKAVLDSAKEMVKP